MQVYEKCHDKDKMGPIRIHLFRMSEYFQYHLTI